MNVCYAGRQQTSLPTLQGSSASLNLPAPIFRCILRNFGESTEKL